MACGNCGTSTSGKPSGCQSNGGCSTGGCNRMNVFDWLHGLPLSDAAKPFPIMEISFNTGSRKEFYKNTSAYHFEKGDWVAVEGVGGFDLGQISLQGELVKLQMKKYGITDNSEIKKVLRPASESDLALYQEHKSREQEIMVRSRAMARSMKLDMKIAEVELQADGKKGTFFYTAEHRVDFRELIKVFATDFRMKVEMRQIGARQESAKVGGIGSCGRELCCSTWLTDFKTVNTAAARYQNLSINQTKLSGQCGRLKCCLNYELDTYMDALKGFPSDADTIETAQGKASLQKRDIFRNLMWYSYYGSNKQYPITIDRVMEIRNQNKEGIKPEELGAIEIEKHGKLEVEVDKGFVNDVGQLSLKALERNSRNRKKKAAKPESEAKASGNENANKQQRGGGNKGQGKSNQPKPKNPNQPAKTPSNNPDQAKGPNPQKQKNPEANRPPANVPADPNSSDQPQQAKKEGGAKENRRPPRNRNRGDKQGKPDQSNTGGESPQPKGAE